MVPEETTLLIVDLVRRAIAEEKKGNYAKAIELLLESEKNILHVIEHNIEKDTIKDRLRIKCQRYRKRAKQLKYCLEKAKIMKRMKTLSV